MNIGIIGYGKMGKLIEQQALLKGHKVTCKGSPRTIFKDTPLDTLKQVDVFIDFSHADAVENNIKQVISLKKNLIEGTTGWDSQNPATKELIYKSGIGFLFSANFSLGVKLFLNILEKAAELMNSFEDYDVSVIEQHHNQKADSPSGTALAVTNVLLPKIERKKTIACNTSGKLEPTQLHVSSLRCGSIPGTHSVLFDSLVDNITITHQARNKDGFASGAVTAAEWLKGKSGIYTLADLFNN